MKKTIIIAIVLLVTAGLAFAAAASEKAAPAASGELVIYTSMSEELQEKIFGGFEEKYPGIKIEVIEGGAGELKSRVKAEAGNPQGDIITGITYADVPEMGSYFLSYYPPNN
ncbi:MAG: extracellular solute-binding protein, partial [Spirochaetales bacterium]|nr:extracellular solute-binding protein [Spirochaetales bacterium]